MSHAMRCDAVDMQGTRCGLMAGHSGQHAMGAQRKASFGRIILTPILVLVAAIIVGTMLGQAMAAFVIGAIVSIVYILVASRR